MIAPKKRPRKIEEQVAEMKEIKDHQERKRSFL
jgi:hypothetical protein